MSHERDRLFRLLHRGLLLPILFLNGWLLAIVIDRLDPLVGNAVAAILLAFILDYPILFLQRHGLRRPWAIATVFLGAAAVIAVLAIGLVPLLVAELRDLMINLPRWFDIGSARLASLEDWINTTELPIEIDLNNAITQTISRLSVVLQSLSGQLLTLLTRALNSLFDFLTINVLAIFLIFGGEQVWDGIFSRVPSRWHFTRSLLRQTFQDYFIGQAILASLQSVVMIVLFALLNVPYALLFGLTIGLTTLVPYAGAVSTIAVAIVLAFNSPALALKVAIVSIIIGQIIDTAIAPRIVGDATGLNPVWPIVALLVGANLAGFLGLLLAVPTASFVKRLTDRLLDGLPPETPRAIASQLSSEPRRSAHLPQTQPPTTTAPHLSDHDTSISTAPLPQTPPNSPNSQDPHSNLDHDLP
ncbi:MAG: AI-2E family transporter [Coleofasciculaceae cyanobacterium RL_1_1]|nr:AI-2E family transporter [Coleofasciculaceae cyanobacterium RL_1_1]